MTCLLCLSLVFSGGCRSCGIRATGYMDIRRFDDGVVRGALTLTFLLGFWFIHIPFISSTLYDETLVIRNVKSK